jgi:nucleoside-diphosphate-sugar epimerase
VFASAVDVFAPSQGLIDESSPVRNTELYPASKLMGEALVSDWAQQTGSSAVLARVGHVYGPGEGAFGKAIPTFIRAALEDRPLIVYGDGSTMRDLFYVADVVEALIRTATASFDEKSTVMILAGSSSTTVAALAHQIADIAGKPGLVKFDRDRDGGYSTRFNTEKMKRLIGDWMSVPLSVGLHAEVEYFKRDAVRA